MRKLTHSILSSFAVGCTILMLSMLIPYWTQGTIVFETMAHRYDEYVLGIFVVGLVSGGMGHFIYQLNALYQVKVFLHYGTTVATVIFISIWLNIISLTWSQLLEYGVTVSIIFVVVWFINYMNLKKEAAELNALLKQRGN